MHLQGTIAPNAPSRQQQPPSFPHVPRPSDTCSAPSPGHTHQPGMCRMLTPLCSPAGYAHITGTLAMQQQLANPPSQTQHRLPCAHLPVPASRVCPHHCVLAMQQQLANPPSQTQHRLPSAHLPVLASRVCPHHLGSCHAATAGHPAATSSEQASCQGPVSGREGHFTVMHLKAVSRLAVKHHSQTQLSQYVADAVLHKCTCCKPVPGEQVSGPVDLHDSADHPDYCVRGYSPLTFLSSAHRLKNCWPRVGTVFVVLRQDLGLLHSHPNRCCDSYCCNTVTAYLYRVQAGQRPQQQRLSNT